MVTSEELERVTYLWSKTGLWEYYKLLAEQYPCVAKRLV